jgi:hypothetical protein
MGKIKRNISGPPVNKSFPQEFIYGLKAFVLTGFLIFAIQLFRGTGQSEGPDKIIYLGSIALAGVFLLMGLVRDNFTKGKYFYSISAFVLTVLGVVGIEEHDPINGVVLSNRLWLGFGPFVLLLTLFISLYIFNILEWHSLKKPWKILFSSIILANLILVIPSFWQSSKTVIDADHSEYVMNEIISTANGKWPYSNFIPQYQTFYGFLLKPFADSMSASQISNITFIGLTLISFLTIALGVIIAWIGLGKRSLIVSIGLIVPLTTLTQFPVREGYMGSIASLLSGLSIRVFPGLILLALLVKALEHFKGRQILSRYVTLGLLGVLAGFVSWQSQDFGVAAAITSFLVITFAGSSKFLDIKSLIATLVGFISGFSVYPVMASLSGFPINFDYFLFFTRQFGSGFGAERIRTIGPVLVILPLIVLLVVTHGIYLYKSKHAESKDSQLYLNSLIGFSFSVWSFAGFTYYLNRSYASGQMQILFLSIAISLAALIGILLKSSSTIAPSGFLFSKLNRDKKTFVWFVPLAIIFSLPLATLILTPNPQIELKRISEGSEKPRWPKSTILESVSDAKVAMAYANSTSKTIGFFGASAAFVEKETGVQSLSILNSPFDLFMSQQTVTVSCQYIEEIRPDFIVLSVEGVALFRFKDNSLCETYIQMDIPGVRTGHFAVRINP